jgi:hypothetical protein
MALILMQTITRSFQGGHVIVVIVGAADGAMAMAMVHDGEWWSLVAEEVVQRSTYDMAGCIFGEERRKCCATRLDTRILTTDSWQVQANTPVSRGVCAMAGRKEVLLLYLYTH